METIKWAVNKMPKTADSNLPIMGLDEVRKARAFHESFPQYSVTPLAKLDHMAAHLGLKEVYVKDESYRFGLNAFKVLGGSFAMARYIAKQTGKDVSELPYNVLTSEELRKEFGQATFFTATDGNHGRGVAWAPSSTPDDWQRLGGSLWHGTFLLKKHTDYRRPTGYKGRNVSI